MSITTRSGNVESAVAYVTGASPLGRALPVIPLGRDKRPLIKWGNGLAPDTEDRVREVWGRFPDAGIAVALRGSGLLVLDVDGIGHGGQFDEAEVLADIEGAFGLLPPTLTATTPGAGRHLFFLVPDGVDVTAFGKRLVNPMTGVEVVGCDLKGSEDGESGGFVAVPLDLAGEVIDGRSWSDITEPVVLPASIRPAARRGVAPAVGSVIAEGQRNNTLASLAGSMRARGMSESSIREALRVTNQEQCRPPLADEEVTRIAASVARYEPVAPATTAAGPAPLPAGVTGGDILARVESLYRRFVVLPSDEAATAVVLFTAFTHVVDAFDAIPYLNITSPEKQCGKTQLMEVMRELVAHPLHASSMTASVVYRGINADGIRRTLMLDEIDTVYGRKPTETGEALRTVLNAGNRRKSATVMRTNRNTGKNEEFDAFGPKVLGGIGDIPDTVADRCIKIAMRRGLPAELEALDFAEDEVVDAACSEVAPLLAAWGAEVVEQARRVRSEVGRVDGLSARASDAWKPLITVATLAGGDWPDRARRAAAALSIPIGADSDSGSLARRLLVECHEAFMGDDRLSSAELVRRLRAMPDAPWVNTPGYGLDPSGLSRLLRGYEVKPMKLRVPGEPEPVRGYRREDFVDAWARYGGIVESVYPGETRNTRNISAPPGHSARNMPGTCSGPPVACSGSDSLSAAVVPGVPASAGDDRGASPLTSRQRSLFTDIREVVEAGAASPSDPAGLARALGGITSEASDFRVAYEAFAKSEAVTR